MGSIFLSIIREYVKLNIQSLRGGYRGNSVNAMKITVSDKAHNWYIDEMGLEKGDGVRFFGKVYGKTEVHDNFSVGINVGTPTDPLATETIDGITYFIEKSDEWFFKGYDFQIEYNDEMKEVSYHFKKQ
ncbi:HesB/YadR/YfhF family protein [Oceanobacillus luteolus]|nr:hypothetical protein [Oceanobacillus luteolus]